MLGVDTLVAVDGRVLGKPAGAEQAREYLRLLSGRTHAVHSGLCLRVDGVEHVRHAVTGVTFATLDAERPRLVPRHRRVARPRGCLCGAGPRGGAGAIDRG